MINKQIQKFAKTQPVEQKTRPSLAQFGIFLMALEEHEMKRKKSFEEKTRVFSRGQNDPFYQNFFKKAI